MPSSMREAWGRSVVTVFIVPIWDYDSAMRVIAVSNLKAFWEVHADAEAPLRTWLEAVHGARWTKPTDITAQLGGTTTFRETITAWWRPWPIALVRST